MKIAILGGSGFIGQHLAKESQARGHEVFIFSRKKNLPLGLTGFQNIHLVSSSKPLAIDLEAMDAVINLAGEAIVGERWSPERKQALRSSRVDFTKEIITELKKVKQKPSIFLQGSAIGFYGSHESGSPVFSEESEPGKDFLGELCFDWEKEGLRANELGIRTIILRTGVVLSPESGALKQMLVPFKLFAGGPLGSGKQYMSWIHITDMVHAILFLTENPNAEGIFNLTAPNPCSNQEFSSCLGKVLHRPSILPVPGFAITALYGDGAEVILKGQNAIPKRLLAINYPFQFPELEMALKDLL